MRAHTLPYGTSASNGFHFTRTLVVNHRRQCRLWEEDKKTVFWQIQLAHRWAGRFPEISEFDSVPLVRAMDKPTSLTSALDSSPITLATTRLTDCAATSAPDSGKGITCLWTGLCIQLSQLPDLNMLMWQRHFFHWQSGMAIRYSLFLTPPELSRGHNSKPASLQASKLCHQACTLYFYYVCQTIPSSWHVLPQDCYWLFHKLDTVLPWSYWHCPANFVLSLHKTTSPSKASRDHLQYERTLTLKDYTQETPVPLP